MNISYANSHLQVLALLSLITVSPVWAGSVTYEVQSLDEIQRSVREFVVSQQNPGSSVEVSVKAMDKRLRLPVCGEPLLASWSPGSRSIGRVTVQAECLSPKPWRVHVQATATVEGVAWVLNRGVRRGDVLSRSMLQQQPVTIGSNNASMRSSAMPIVSLDHWLGYAFSRRVGAGMVLDERMLEPAELVKKGESVLIVHKSNGLQLQTKGTAIGAAAKGDRIQVRNSASGKLIDATVVARGLVHIHQ